MSTSALHSVDFPAELWMRIFALTIVRTWEDDLNLPEPHVDRPPLLFGRVCRRWREVSLSCSELWSALGIRILTNSMECGVPDGIKRWLAHARDRPLELALYGDHAPAGVASKFMQMVLWKYLIQARTLLIRLSEDWDSDKPWLKLPTVDTLSRLEAVQIVFQIMVYPRWLWPLMDAQLPALRRVIIPACRIVLNQIPLPVKHLMRLTHIYFAPNMFYQPLVWILRQCRDLVSCSLTFRMGGSRNERPGFEGSHILLPHLRVLRLWVESASYWQDIFVALTLPSLDELEIEGEIWPFSLVSVVPLLNRSHCSLRTVSLLNSNISHDTLLALLRAPEIHAHLEYLKLSVKRHGLAPPYGMLPLSSALVRALNPSLTKEVLLPRLQAIKVDGRWASAPPWDDGAFADMVVSRCGSTTVARMTRVAISANLREKEHFHVKDFEMLRELEGNGLHVSLVPDTW